MPGKVLKGYTVEAPQERVVADQFPGVHGQAEIDLGLGPSNIVIPMVVFDRTLRNYASVWALLELLKERRREAEVGTLFIEINESVEAYPNCKLATWQRMSDILPDVGAGFVTTHMVYFVHVLLVFRQLGYDVKKKEVQ